MGKNGDAYYNEEGELAFTKDGIIYKNDERAEKTEQNWVNSSKRILFLLKDQHQIRDKGKSFWPEDIRYWLKDGENDKGDALKQKKENRELGNRFFKHLANIFWGLSKADLKNDWEYDEVVKVRGMDIVFVTTAKSNEEAYDLLSELGVPFRK